MKLTNTSYKISSIQYVLKLTNLEFGACRKHFPDEALAELHGVDEGVEGHGKVLSVFMRVNRSCQYLETVPWLQ